MFREAEVNGLGGEPLESAGGGVGGLEHGAGEVCPKAEAQTALTPVQVVAAATAEEMVHPFGLAALAEPQTFGEPSGVELAAGQVRRYLSGAGKKRKKTQALAKTEPARELGVEQKILILDTWKRSGLPAMDFSELIGIHSHTLYSWKKRFDEDGPAGLAPKPKGCPKGSRLPELTKRSILMLKDANPEWGCQRISDMLARGPGYPASPSAIAKLLHESGYEVTEKVTEPHAPPVRRFERASPNQLWQTDLFTFMLKRQNRRVFMVLFMDDHSRFITGYGVHGSSSAAMVMEVLEAAIASFQAPEEVLTDNGAQYITWRGTSAFAKLCQRRGIKQIVASPRHPQTLGKVERFWGTLWREFLQGAIFLDLEDARRRIGLFIDHYNFQRPHQGLEGHVTPAEKYFGVASEVLAGLKLRLQKNSLELAQNGLPKQPFFMTGQIGGKPFSLHAEGERFFLQQEGGGRQEVELVTPHGSGTNADAPDCEPDALSEGLVGLAQELQEGDHE